MNDTREQRTTKIGEFGPTVESNTGMVIRLQGRWNGVPQTVKVDPADVPALIAELEVAARIADGPYVHEVVDLPERWS